MGSRFLILTALCVTALMIGLISTNSPWMFLLIFLLPASSLVVLKLIRKRIFQRYWICPACAQPLPMGEGSRFCEMDLLIFLLPASSLVVLKLIRKRIFQRYWICPACAQPLPMGEGSRFCEMDYVPQCPHCAHMLEQPPELAAIQTEYDPQKPLEPAYDLPIPGSKWPCLISGGITTVFALLLLPLIFIPDGSKPLDMMGVGVGVVLLFILLGFGIILLFCRHTEPEEIQQPIVIVRERKIVSVLGGIQWGLSFVMLLLGFGIILLFCRHTEPEEIQQPIVIVRERKIVSVLGGIQWGLSFVMLLAAVIVAGTPPFDAACTFVITLIGLPFMLLAVWMLLAGRNRTLFVFRDNSMWYISSWGRKREFAPGQVVSVQLTANRSIHLLNKDGKKLCCIETNMRGIPRFADWLESTNLTATLTPNMEKQTKQADQEESTVQWREEYRTRWHDHIKVIRVGMWSVIVFFAIGVLAPIPLYLLGAKFTTVMKIGAVAPIPFLVFCMVFAPVLLFDDRPKNATFAPVLLFDDRSKHATPEWNKMHIKMPIILVMLIGLIYISQVHYLWDGWILQEADINWDWLLRVLTIATTLIVLMILRTPKRMRLNAGFFMGIVGFFVAVGLHYYVNAAFIGPALHYPAIITDSHANDPDVDDDNYELTIVMNNGKKTKLVVTEKMYEMALNGEPLEICHRESPFGVILLDIHVPQEGNGKSLK